MNQNPVQFVPLLLCLILSACSSSPPASFYMLDSLTTTSEGEETGKVVVGIGPVKFPEYLMRPQIVTRGPGGELSLAEFDRWAEPLEDNFERVLAVNVDNLMEDTIVMHFPFGGGRVEPDYRIMLQVFRFDVDTNRQAELNVRWEITDENGEPIAPARRSVYRARGSGGDRYSSAVGALNEVLELFSRDLADALADRTAG